MPSRHSSSRRNFLKGAGLAGAASVFSGACSSSDRPRIAKNLIFMVADGMGVGTLSYAHHWQLRHRGRALEWMQLLQRPGVRRAFQETASASSPVTDSAAAGSAWGCGQRVNNRSINFSTDGQALKPIFMYAKEAGKATGLVSTCRITHATPASFVANEPHRNAENQIAEQYLERAIDVCLGGGMRHFKREDVDLLEAYEAKGYKLARTKKELIEFAGQWPLLGLFADSHIPYAIDRANNRDLVETPGLELMFEAALKSLQRCPEGFVLQVEGGRVDHAGHANDPGAILHEQLEFDRCIPIAVEFLKANPDTLIIVTTDHGTGGCQLNGWGDGYADSGPALDRINYFKSSFEAIGKQIEKRGKFDAAYFEQMTGLTVTNAKQKTLNEALAQGVPYISSTIANVFADELINATAIGWTSNNHTSEHVELAALGPGVNRLPIYLKNYELHGFMRQALALDGLSES